MDVIELNKGQFRQVEKVCQAKGWNYFSNGESWDTFDDSWLAASVNANKYIFDADKLIREINYMGIATELQTEFGFDVIAYINTNKVERNTVKSWE